MFVSNNYTVTSPTKTPMLQLNNIKKPNLKTTEHEEQAKKLNTRTKTFEEKAVNKIIKKCAAHRKFTGTVKFIFSF